MSVRGLLAKSVLFVTLWGAPTVALAAPARQIVEVLHVRSDGCLGTEALAHAVGFWLQRDTIEGAIEFDVRQDRGDAVVVTRRDGVVVGERRLRTAGGTCADATDAVGLAIALAIDATVLDRIGIEPPSRAPRPAVSISTPGPLPERATRARASSFRLGLEAFGAVMLDVLPRVVGGAGGGADASLGPVDLRLTGFVVGTSTSALGSSGGNVSVDLAAGRFDGCLAPSRGYVAARACLGFAAGLAFGRGEGYTPSFSATAGWVATAARVDVRLALTDAVGFVLGIDAFFDLLRPRFEVASSQGGTSAFERLPPVGVGVTLGPTFFLW